MKDYDLTYEWLDFLASQKSRSKSLFKEEKIRDFVSGDNAVVAQDVGVLDTEFSNKDGDFIQIDPAWISSNIVSVSLVNGGTVQFHKKYADRLKTAIEQACRATGWTPENPNTGYCPKPNGGFVMRRSRAPSESTKPVEQRRIGGHAWGTSIDVGTASENPMGGGGKIRQFPQYIDAMKKNGFIWGGDWSNKDDMHFEVNVTGKPVPDTGAGLDAASSAASYGGGGTSFLQSAGVYTEALDRRIFHFNDKTQNHLYKKYKKYFDSLLEHLKKELKINKPVKIVLEDDKENGKKVLGRTGGYINQEIKIHIFCSGRHIKDIMRSLAHEMVHHHQNLRGEFKNHEPTTQGYAQSNKHLRKMEEEAYLKGNILFRDWEDNYKYRGEKQ
jgi:hypothetical protein